MLLSFLRTGRDDPRESLFARVFETVLSSAGGFCSLTGTAAEFDVSMWRGNWRVRDSDTTTSGQTATRYSSVIPDNSWTIEMPRDSVNFPTMLGLTVGTTLSTLVFKLGADTKCDIVSNTLITDIDKVCNPGGDVVRITISGKGGSLLQDQAVPT